MPLPDILNIGFKVDEPKLWSLNLPVEEIDIHELEHNLDIPYLEQEGTDDWNLTPKMLIENFDKEKTHAGKVSRELNDFQAKGLVIFDIKKIREFVCWKSQI